MANSPRKPTSSRPPKDANSPAEDLFSSDPANTAPAAGSSTPPSPAAMPDDDDWQLEEPQHKPASAPAKPRISALPTQPIPAPANTSFESNTNIPSAVPLSIPRHTTPVPPPATAAASAPSFPPAKAPSQSPADSFDIDDELTLESPAKPATPRPPSTADSPQPRYDLGKLTSAKSSGTAKSDPKSDAPASPSDPDFEPDTKSAPGFDSDSTPGSDSEEASGTKIAPRFSSKAGLMTAAAIILALTAVFAVVLYSNRPSAPAGTAKATPSLPITGNLVTLTKVDSGWRARQQGDLVSPVDVVLPTATRLQSEFLPQVQFTFDPAATKPGFLRFIFLDPDRKISGDVRVMKLANGTIEPLSSGAIVSGPGATIYGSFGFLDRPAFVSYASNNDQRWAVEISESSDYNAKEKDWHLLETFDIRNATLP